MIKYLKLLSLVLALTILFSSCTIKELFSLTPPEDISPPNQENPGETNPPVNVPTDFTIAHYTGEKLDPYTSANRANVNIIKLCYDGLIYLDREYTPVPLLADYVVDGKTIIFTLKPYVCFADGTSVTSQDCVYSFEQASKSESIYSTRLSLYVDKWESVSSTVFKVTLKNTSLYNINLFDFPIVKKGTYGNDTLPTGSGRYKLSQNSDGEDVLLHYENPFYDGEFNISEIKLLEISKAQDLSYNFNYGLIHAAYADLSDGTSRYKGNIELVSFSSSSFVFAVVNSKKDYMQDIRVSQAINYAINRSEISTEIFDGMCDSVWHPFSPGWNKIVKAELNEDIYSTTKAHQLLNEAGWNLSDLKRTWKGKEQPINIICNNEDLTKVEVAKALVTTLENLGFTVTLTQYNWNYYQDAIKKGEFDIYLGKVAVPPNMDISFMFTDTICNNGRSYSNDFFAAINSFYNEEIDVRDFVSIFSDNMPFIPLYYTRSALAVNRVVSGSFTPSESDLFVGIENWAFGND